MHEPTRSLDGRGPSSLSRHPSLVGTQHRIGFQDSPCFGPCSVDPTTHSELRRDSIVRFVEAFQGDDRKGRRADRLRRELREGLEESVLTANELRQRLDAFASEPPIVVWTSFGWSDRINFWWVCDACQRAVTDPKRIYVAQPTLPEHDGRNDVECLGIFNHIELVEALSQAAPLTRKLLDESAGLWLAFAGSDPLAFDRLRRIPSEALPRTCEPFRYGFPVRDADGRLRLSALDQRLLGFLRQDEWRRPWDVLSAASPDPPLLFPYTESFVAYRLHAWREHRAEAPLIVSGPRPEGVNGMTRRAYRLTSEGARALADGIDSLSQAPPMEIGGCVAYVDPYAAEENADDWRIAKL